MTCCEMWMRIRGLLLIAKLVFLWPPCRAEFTRVIHNICVCVKRWNFGIGCTIFFFFFFFFSFNFYNVYYNFALLITNDNYLNKKKSFGNAKKHKCWLYRAYWCVVNMHYAIHDGHDYGPVTTTCMTCVSHCRKGKVFCFLFCFCIYSSRQIHNKEQVNKDALRDICKTKIVTKSDPQ